MRSENSMKNIIFSVILSVTTMFIGFVAQKIFLEILGTEYLGVQGLFTNILSILGIVELGIGPAMIYKLYKPLANNNKEKIKSLMEFYKNCYILIAIVITFLGLAILPFLKYIVGETSIEININYIYILFLVDTACSYLLTYKRSILYADQKNYILDVVHIIYIISMNVIQMIMLVFTRNYILYLIIKVICRLLENIILTIITNKKYPFIKEKVEKKLTKREKKSIYINLKGLIYQKISGVASQGINNIIISSFLGVSIVGMYSNYNLILQALNNLISQAFSSITASVGNLLTEMNAQKSYNTYKNLLFINSWIFMFSSIGILCVIEPFITIWIGKEYILPFSVLAVLVFNFYIQGMKRTSNTFKEAAGIYYKGRFLAISEALLNIIFSIIFVKLYGLVGVFLGDIISAMIWFFYGYPKYIYKPIFRRTYIQYIKDYIPYIFASITSLIITYFIVGVINVENIWIKILSNIIIVLVVPNILYLLFFLKTKEFNYFKNIIINFFGGIIKKSKVKLDNN